MPGFEAVQGRNQRQRAARTLTNRAFSSPNGYNAAHDSSSGRFRRGCRDLPDRHLGCIRGHHSSATRDATIPADPFVLQNDVDHLEIHHWARIVAEGPRDVAGLLRPDLAADFGWRVGRGTRSQFWADAIWCRLGRGHDRSAARLCDRSVSQRHDIFHVGTRRCRPALAAGACAGSRRRGLWVWFSCRRYWLPAIHLRFVLEARGKYFAAGFACGHAPHCGRAASAPRLPGRQRGVASPPQGLGVLGRRTHGEPSFVSGAGVLPLAA